MQKDNNKLINLYEEYESAFNIKEQSNNLSNYVKANGNCSLPIHRWFRFKEGFSGNLLEYVLTSFKWDSEKLHLLDPFCGGGTSLVSSMILQEKGWNISSTGVEVNPFLCFVAKTKCNSMSYCPELLLKKGKQILEQKFDLKNYDIPALTTIQRSDVFPTQTLKKILEIRSKIEEFGCKKTYYPLLLGLAQSLEEVSGIRKDGRALRLTGEIPDVDIEDVLYSHWKEIAEDINWLREKKNSANLTPSVIEGDGRTLKKISKNSTFDLIFYSPPYLNNIDYTEVYKIELWMLKFITSYQDFRSLRLKTFRSHPSVKFPEVYSFIKDKRMELFNNEIKKLIAVIPKDKNYKWRVRLIFGYFDDIYVSLLSQKRILKKHGKIVIVVGNSLHGSGSETFIVATDLLITRIAFLLDLKVEGIIKARNLKRRRCNSNFLRESIIILSRK